MASHKQPEQGAWYRSSTATLVAGVVGLVLIAGLVVAVVQMSGRWNTREESIVPAPFVPEAPYVVATTRASTSAGSSTSYPPGVQVSTTDIGLPSEIPTSSAATSSDSPSPSPSSPPPSTQATAPTFPGPFPTRVTGRPGPRLNETRTLYPKP